MHCNQKLNSQAQDETELYEQLFALADGAYSAATIRCYRAELTRFRLWCSKRGTSSLPASGETVAAYMNDMTAKFSAPTLSQQLSAICFAHRLLELPSPRQTGAVWLARKRAIRQKRSRPRQALGLTSDRLNTMMAACPDSLAGVRNAAMLLVGYDTLCRVSELVALRVDDFDEKNGVMLIRRAKNDPGGKGRVTYLSPATQTRLRSWLDQASIAQGPIFRGLHTRRVSETAMDPSCVRRMMKKLAGDAGLASDEVKGVSGHSLRIGAAQDLVSSGTDMMAIMRLGGWTSIDVLARYAERADMSAISAKRWAYLQAFASL
jgi:integrase